MIADALFEPLGERPADGTSLVMPTELSRGPWSPDALHGGPVAALVVRSLERIPAPTEMRLVRVTIELVRPVPLAQLAVRAVALASPRRVGVVEAELRSVADDQLVAKARAVRIRVAPSDIGDPTVDEVPERPEHASPPWASAHPAFHSHAVEHRFVRGHVGEIGPATDWIRLRVPVVAGEEPTGWQRAVAAADFVNGLSSLGSWDEWLFINPDLTVHLWREPDGVDICLDAVTRTDGDGIAVADATLFDRHGRIGRSVQSLLIDRR